MGKVPHGRWERLAVVGALALDRAVAATGSAGATGTTVLSAFAERALVPALHGRPDAAVVLGNPGAHEAGIVRAAFGRAGLGHRHLPLYLPDPWGAALPTLIERAQSKPRARPRQGLERSLGPALATIATQDARGRSRRRGYAAAGCAANRPRALFGRLPPSRPRAPLSSVGWLSMIAAVAVLPLAQGIVDPQPEVGRSPPLEPVVHARPGWQTAPATDAT
ncbi:MAG TPA: hypothetical protein VFY87_18360 [Geminicoccaceae bacterium]|nr:hypothetical protein [Geminicoccaceae bacterium]